MTRSIVHPGDHVPVGLVVEPDTFRVYWLVVGSNPVETVHPVDELAAFRVEWPSLLPWTEVPDDIEPDCGV